jgi:hypothetical protein
MPGEFRLAPRSGKRPPASAPAGEGLLDFAWDVADNRRTVEGMNAMTRLGLALAIVIGVVLPSSAWAISQGASCRLGAPAQSHPAQAALVCGLSQDPWQDCAEDPWQLSSEISSRDTFSDPWQDSVDPWQPFVAMQARDSVEDPWQPTFSDPWQDDVEDPWQ